VTGEIKVLSSELRGYDILIVVDEVVRVVEKGPRFVEIPEARDDIRVDVPSVESVSQSGARVTNPVDAIVDDTQIDREVVVDGITIGCKRHHDVFPLVDVLVFTSVSKKAFTTAALIRSIFVRSTPRSFKISKICIRKSDSASNQVPTDMVGVVDVIEDVHKRSQRLVRCLGVGDDVADLLVVEPVGVQTTAGVSDIV